MTSLKSEILQDLRIRQAANAEAFSKIPTDGEAASAILQTILVNDQTILSALEYLVSRINDQ